MTQSVFYFHTSPVAGRSGVSKRKVRATVAGIAKDGIMYFGISRADHEDQFKFSKRLGREIALKKADRIDAEHKVVIPKDLDPKYLGAFFTKNAIKYVTKKYSVVVNKK